MDVDLLLESEDDLCGDDFFDHLTKDYQWSSILDATNASPSEILADATPFLVPPISPGQSNKSSSNESSNSDSSSDDDSKNSSNTTERDSSTSPFGWIPSFDDELPNPLKLEDIEKFLQKCDPLDSISPVEPPLNVRPSERKEPVGPVVAIENGVFKIEGIKLENTNFDETLLKTQHVDGNMIKGNGRLLNTDNYFKIVNEHNFPNITKDHAVLKNQIKLVINQKRVPVTESKANITNMPGDKAKAGKIAISPLPQSFNCQRKVSLSSSPKNNIVLYPVVTNNTTNGSVVQKPVPALDDISMTSIDLSKLSEAEIKALKKQQRMIKNRESACQSRQKRKNYVLSLQHELKEAHNEIAALRQENAELRSQLSLSFPKTRKIPRLDGRILVPKKNIAVLCAMVFMVSLNFNILGWNSKPIVGPFNSHGSTRHLLWSEDSKEVLEAFDDDANKSTYSPDCQNSTLKPGDFVNINQNESLRIAGELKRWIGRGKTLNWTQNEPKKRPKNYLTDDKINGALFSTYRLFNKLNLDANFDEFNARDKMQVNPRLRRMRRSKDLEFSETAVIDYDTLYPKIKPKDFDYGDFGEWNALLQALERRDDTFYVVGVGKGEHLLLPAVSHNVTRPPKMALILPARTVNDSSMKDHVTLMQIDCSVVNTSLVKLKSEALPESLRMKKEQLKPVVYPTKPDKKTFYKKTDKHSIDNISHVLHNISNNISNQPISNKKLDLGKDEFFAQYLFSKYDKNYIQVSSSNNTKTKVKPQMKDKV